MKARRREGVHGLGITQFMMNLFIHFLIASKYFFVGVRKHKFES